MGSNKENHISFAEATAVEKLDSHTYRVHLNDAFTNGAVPNGGYTGSCMLAVAKAHLSTRAQPDTLTAHFEYAAATVAGPAIVIVEEIKLGRQMSRLHMTLWQGGFLPQAPWINPSVSRRTVLAYTIHTNLSTSTGLTLPTGYEVTAAAALPPLPDFEKLKTKDADDLWEKSELPKFAGEMRSLRKWAFYVPRMGPLTPGVLDMWICLASGERITQGALAYVVDSFPYNLHEFLAPPEMRKLLKAPREKAEKTKQRASLWFPTLVMNLEVKTALPEEGVEWLAVRVTSKQVKDGKMDLDVLVRDVEGELIALSYHTAMIVLVQEKKGNTKSVL